MIKVGLKLNNLYHRNPIYQSGLPSSAILVYFYLEKHGARQNRCFHSIKTIANNLSLSCRTINRILKTLEQQGYILRTHQYRKDGAKTSNVYEILK